MTAEPFCTPTGARVWTIEPTVSVGRSLMSR